MPSDNNRIRRPGDRIAPDWQPRHLAGGSIDDVEWTGWTLDPARPLLDLARAHMKSCRDRLLARRTVEGYDQTDAAFIAFLEARFGTIAEADRAATVADLHTNSIYAFMKRVGAKGNPLSPGAQASEAGRLRTLAGFGIEIGAVSANALAAFQLPETKDDTEPASLTDVDLRRLIRRLAADTTFEGQRLRLYCHLEADTGIRPAELAAVRLPAFDLAERAIALQATKYWKNRVAFYGEATAKVLSEYLRFRGTPGHDELFVGRRGPMTESSFQHDFRELADELELVGRAEDGTVEPATLYTLRRTFARRFAEGGGDVEELAKLMGHSPSSIPMLFTAYYSPSKDRLKRAHDRVRPLDALLEEAA
jgi:integrase